MKRYLVFLTLLISLIISKTSNSQLYQGPANGSVPNGVTVSTDNFLDMMGEPISPYIQKPRNEEDEVEDLPDYLNKVKPTGTEGSNVWIDKSITPKKDSKDGTDSNPLILKGYQGFLDPGNYIPPDQHLAVGPTHVMGTDNGRFRIWDKNGILVKTISANSWYSTALNSASAFDPKILYDQLSKRWIMVWLDQNNTTPRGYYLISVSDDSIPLGTWYNYAIKSSLFGSSESGTWSDYQGVGFDNNALYITGRQFVFGGNFQGSKVRIISKAQLYANNAGPLNWTDMWDIRDPNTLSARPDNIRPSIFYSNGSEYYMMTTAPFTTGTYVILYKITNPLTSPAMTGVDIPVTAYSTPPLANQLGGSTIPIETGGSSIRNEPTFRNGFLWATHAVSSGTGYSNINYVKINVSSNLAVEDASFGATGFYHYYPAISVDQNQNVIINYSRSGDNEYIGAFYNSRLDSDPAGTFNGSSPFQNGKANYVKDFGGGRNRWGDYSGSWLDPSDQTSFWTLTQYAETPVNTWASWINKVRLVPFSGPHVFSFLDTLNFGVYEVGAVSDTLNLKIYNYGSSTLTVSNLQTGSTQFQVTPGLNLPVNMNYQDSITVRMVYKPTAAGNITDSLTITSNDSPKKVFLKGKGYVINPAAQGTMYGVTGTQENGVFLTINTSNGTGNTVGLTGYSQLTALGVKKSNGILYGIVPTATSTLVRINSSLGDAYPVTNIPVANIKGLAFDANDDMYFSVSDGRLFKYNMGTNDTDYVGNTGIANLYGITFNYSTGQLWGMSLSNGVYKINKSTAVSTLVGTTGFTLTPAIAFGIDGKLYGTAGIGNQVSTLFTIDTVSGTGTSVGSTGKKGINGIAVSPTPIGIQPISNIVPDKFELYQNYPNPFNPSTKILFDIPKQTFVKIRIYDITGREIAILVNENFTPGRYGIQWDASNYPSGVYFYRIETNENTVSKKMILVK